jgi:hypothetical protein
MATKILGAVAVMWGGLTLLAPVQAQTVTGKAFGTYVNAAGVTSQSPVATLSPTGGIATGQADVFGVAGVVDARELNAVTTGDLDNTSKKAGAQSVSEVEQVSVAGGAISADIVTAVATSYLGQLSGGRDATGSGFTNLVVNGVPVTTDVAPNTRVNLLGVGYAILNERIPSGDGVNSFGITVNMIHVVMQNLLGQQTGEVIIGSASSRVAR